MLHAACRMRFKLLGGLDEGKGKGRMEEGVVKRVGARWHVRCGDPPCLVEKRSRFSVSSGRAV